MDYSLLFTGFATAILSYMGLFPLRRCLARWQVLDIPNARSSHTHPTPRGGGIAIVLFTLTGLWLWALTSGISAQYRTLLAYTLGAGGIAAVSWVDDLHSLPNRLRFGIHAIAAVIAILAFGYWHTAQAPGVGAVSLGWFGIALTFLWIVGLTNAYNFMDGIDGIAAGQAVVAGVFWAVLGQQLSMLMTAVLGVLVAGSSLGFLGHNWSPARVFMGDVSSAFLGYTFAVLPLMDGGFQNALSPWLALLPVWPFVFDAAFTFLRRLLHHENVFAAHRSHLYQRLVVAGVSHRAAATLYISLAAIGSGMALIVSSEMAQGLLIAVLVILLLCFGLSRYVRSVEWRAIGKR